MTPIVAGSRAHDPEWFQKLYDYFAPVREEILAAGYDEDEVNADIEAAVRAVREEHAAKHRRHD